MMSPGLSDLIDKANLKRILAEMEDAKRQISTRITIDDEKEEDVENAPHAGRLLLIQALEKLRRALFEIGKACALDPAFRAKAGTNQGTFYLLFGGLGLDTILLQEPAAVEGFLEGIKTARKQ